MQFSTPIESLFIIMETEVWKDVEGYEKYQASNLWRIKTKSYKNSWYERIMKPQISHSWYFDIKVMVDRKELLRKTHRLVAIAFLPNPNNHPVVMHLDNNPLNNHISNLKWWTYKENTQQCWREWRSNNNLRYRNPNIWKTWILHKDSKKVLQYTKEWEFIREWNATMDIQRELWIANPNISACCLWKVKYAWWFIWKYK